MVRSCDEYSLVGKLEREANINFRDNAFMKILIDTCYTMTLPVLEMNEYLYIVKDSILFYLRQQWEY